MAGTTARTAAGRSPQSSSVPGTSRRCEPEPLASRNEVVLVGRVSGDPEQRSLPSGDLLVHWRVVVDRPPPARPAPEGIRLPTSDTLDCQARGAGLRRSALALRHGDIVQVTGALHRRFYRAGSGALSRCEIEVQQARRLARPRT